MGSDKAVKDSAGKSANSMQVDSEGLAVQIMMNTYLIMVVDALDVGRRAERFLTDEERDH